jgi:hypothetical protein
MTAEERARQIVTEIAVHDLRAMSKTDGPAIEEMVAAALRETERIAYAEGKTEGVLEAARRWEVDPARPNYREAVAAEREACAKVAEEWSFGYETYCGNEGLVDGSEIAAAIRARGGEKSP